MRVISQTAFKNMKRTIRDELREVAQARSKCMQAKRDGKGRMVREQLSWEYTDWKRTLAHTRAQLADCQPADQKHPHWSPAARARNPHMTR